MRVPKTDRSHSTASALLWSYIFTSVLLCTEKWTLGADKSLSSIVKLLEVYPALLKLLFVSRMTGQALFLEKAVLKPMLVSVRVVFEVDSPSIWNAPLTTS